MNTKAITLFASATLVMATACTDTDNAADNSAPVAARIAAAVGRAVTVTPAVSGRAGNDNGAGPATRAVNDRWNKDEISVIVYGSPNSDMGVRYRNVRYVTHSTGATALFVPADPDQTICFTDPDATAKFAAIAPYQPSATPGGLPGDDGLVTMDATKQATPEEQEAIDFLYTAGYTASKSNPTVSFTHDYSFVHIMSRLVLKIETPAEYGFAPDDVQRISRISLGGLCTGGSFELAMDPAKDGYIIFGIDRATWTDDWDITNYAHRVAPNENGVTQRIHTTLLIPNQVASDKTGQYIGAVPLSITLDGRVYQNDKGITGSFISQGESGSFRSATSYEYTVRLKRNGLEVTDATIAPWAEGGGAAGDATPL